MLLRTASAPNVPVQRRRAAPSVATGCYASSLYRLHEVCDGAGGISTGTRAPYVWHIMRRHQSAAAESKSALGTVVHVLYYHVGVPV